MKTEKERIIRLLTKSFEKGAWHGPSVKEALEGVTQEKSTNKLPNSHSIAELVAHMTSWRTFVIKRLQGDMDFKVTDEENFPATSDWITVVAALEESQTKLIETIQVFDINKLDELVEGNLFKYTYYSMLHGIIHHDLYHAAQIVLLKKL